MTLLGSNDAKDYNAHARVTVRSSGRNKWNDVDVEGLKKYMVEEKQFAPERIEKAIERIKKCKGKNSQVRMDSFFTRIPSAASSSTANKKPDPKKNGKGKAGFSGGNAAKKVKR